MPFLVKGVIFIKLFSYIKTIILSFSFGPLYGIKCLYVKLLRKKDAYITLVYQYVYNFIKENGLFPYLNPDVELESSNTNYVWFFWWQGFDNMPDICKLCYKSLGNNLPDDSKLIFLDSSNIDLYLDIPNLITKKIEKGVYTITLLSDFIRNGLLYKYGGFWVDSTIFVAGPIPRELLLYSDWWSIRKTFDKETSVIGQQISKNRWCGFIQKGSAGNPINRFVFYSLLKYMETKSALIEYFIQNILILIAYNNNEQVKKSIDSITPSNENVYELQKYLNHKFDSSIWEKITKETIFFKLSYKSTIDFDNDTFASYLLNLYR